MAKTEEEAKKIWVDYSDKNPDDTDGCNYLWGMWVASWDFTNDDKHRDFTVWAVKETNPHIPQMGYEDQWCEMTNDC